MPDTPRLPLATMLSMGVFALAVSATQLGPLRSSDLFWHLACGRVILAERALPEQDPLTSTAENRRWIQHEWGAQVALAAVDALGGPWALRVTRAVCLAMLLGLLGVLLARIAPSPVTVVLGLTLAWLPLLPHASLRPHLFGWLALLGLTLAFLRHTTPFSPRRYAAYALAIVLWVNLHSSAVMLLPLLAVAFLDEIVGQWTGRRWNRGALRHGLLLTALTGVALLAQPATWRLAPYVLETPVLNRLYSTEWMPLLRPDVWAEHPVIPLITLGLGATCLGLGAWRWARRLGPAIFPGPLLALFVVLSALYTRRMTAFLWIPLLYVWADGRLALRAAGSALRPSRPHWWRPLSPGSWVGHAAWVGGVLLAVALSLPAVGGVLSRHPYLPGRFPEQATRFLAATTLEGRLFNPDGWGGYLSYHLHPRYRVFLDGRWILVGRDVLKDSLRILVRRRDPTPLLDRYDLQVIVQPTDFYLQTPSLPAASWRLAWMDEVAVVLVRRGSKYAANRARICAYYRRHPHHAMHGVWLLSLARRGPGPSPTELPTVLGECS